jgi:glycosyltransferase involved in cell wall biosynthesis
MTKKERQALAGSRPSALVYGDVDLNLLDGSAVWLQSVTQALVAAGCAVTLVLKAPVRTDRLVAPLQGLPEVTIRSPHAEGLLPGLTEASLTVPQAVAVLAAVDKEGVDKAGADGAGADGAGTDGAAPHDLVVLRGRALVSAAARDGAFDGRLWSYLTDVPQAVPAVTPKAAEDLTIIAKASRYLLCQTEELRCFLEGSVAAACGKSVLFPPVLPALDTRRDPERKVAPPGTPLKLVYTGKFAPRWNTLEMTTLPALLAARGVPAEVHMVGDKVHDDPRDPTYKRRMRGALGEVGAPALPGVIWHGGQPRAEAMRLAAAGDVGLSWRHPELDSSLELSTKVLEFGQLGLPVILNRTPMHEALLGADYPLFAATIEDVADVAASVLDPAVFGLAAARTSAAAASFALDQAAARLRAYLARAVPARLSPGSAARAPLRVVIAGHDLKFFNALIGYFRLQPDLEIRIDHWAALGEHNEAKSRELAEWADVIVCEWCGPNAVWYSRHKRRSARLLVRLHRFELDSPYPAQVKIGNVDQVICVSDYYTRLTREKTGWPAAKIVTVPNALDVLQFDRPKLDGARFHLGMTSMVDMRKRVDLALDVLEELRRDDDRYLLFVKSGMPWELWWVWQHQEQRSHYFEAFRRVQRSPLLRDAVVFDDGGPDVPAWLRRIGFVLSTSDAESFHMAPAEGMASRAVPVIRHWPGAETIYDARWIKESPAEMAASIAALSSAEAWEDARQAAHEQIRAIDLGTVAESMLRLVRGGSPASAGAGPAYQLQGSVG